MSGKNKKKLFFDYVFPEMEKCGYTLKKGNRPCDFKIIPPLSFIEKLEGKKGRGFTHFDSLKQILTHLENNKPSNEDFNKSLEEYYQKTQASVPTTPAKSTQTSNLEEKIDSESTTQTSQGGVPTTPAKSTQTSNLEEKIDSESTTQTSQGGVPTTPAKPTQTSILEEKIDSESTTQTSQGGVPTTPAKSTQTRNLEEKIDSESTTQTSQASVPTTPAKPTQTSILEEKIDSKSTTQTSQGSVPTTPAKSTQNSNLEEKIDSESTTQTSQASVPTTPAKPTQTSNLEEKIDSKSTTQTSSTRKLRRNRTRTTTTTTTSATKKDTSKSKKDKSSSASKSSVVKGSRSCKVFFDEEVFPIMEKYGWKLKRGARKSDYRIKPPLSEIAKLGGKTGRGFTHFDSMKQILIHFENHKPTDNKELETVLKEFREIMMNSNRSVTPARLKRKKGSTPNTGKKKGIRSSPRNTSNEEETAKKTNPTTKKRKDIKSPEISKNIYLPEKDIFANILWPAMESEGWVFKPGKGEYGITLIPPDEESDIMDLGKIKSNEQIFDYFKKKPPSAALRKTLRNFKQALKQSVSQPPKKRLRSSKESCSNDEESENDEGSKCGNNMDGLSDDGSDSDGSNPNPPRKDKFELGNNRFMDMVWPALKKLGWFLKHGLDTEIRYFAPCSSSKCDENSAVKGTDYFESSEELLQSLENNIDKYDQSVEKAINHYKSKFFYSDVIEINVE